MPFCSKCGTKYDEGTKFCPGCGVNLGVDASAGGTGKNGFDESFKKINNTPDSTAEYDQNDINQNKVMAVLAYIGLLFLIPLLAAKESRYAKFHTNQGMVLFLAEFAGGMAIGLVGGIFTLMGLGIISSLLSGVFYLASVAFMVLGIYNAATGKAKELPLIGKYKLYK